MSFHNSHNQKRVQKILETLDLIDKSAKSNKTDRSEVIALLQPVLEKLPHAGVASVGPDTTEKPNPDTTEKPKNSPPGSLASYVDTLDQYQLCTVISLAAIRLETQL